MAAPRAPADAPPLVAGAVEVLSIYELMARIIEELPAIGRDQFNSDQNFKFRGVDDVLNALNPLLGKYGVFFVPDVLERIYNQRTTRNGGIMHEVNLHVQYTFFGPAGDFVVASGWGEGTDMGDKATNKAMTGAMKYVLFQVFAVASREQSDTDADRSGAEETVRQGSPPPAAAPLTEDEKAQQGFGWRDAAEMRAVHDALRERIAALDEPMRVKVRELREQGTYGWPMNKENYEQFLTALDALLAEADFGGLDTPDAITETELEGVDSQQS